MRRHLEIAVAAIIVSQWCSGCAQPRAAPQFSQSLTEAKTLISGKWTVKFNYIGPDEKAEIGGRRRAAFPKAPDDSVNLMGDAAKVFAMDVRYPEWSGGSETTASYFLGVRENAEGIRHDMEPEKWDGCFLLFGVQPDSVYRQRIKLGNCDGWIQVREKRSATGEPEVCCVDVLGILDATRLLVVHCELRSWPEPRWSGKRERFEFERAAIDGFINSISVD